MSDGEGKRGNGGPGTIGPVSHCNTLAFFGTEVGNP